MTNTMRTTLRGVSPMMQSKMAMEKHVKGTTPEDEVLGRVYVTKDGRSYVPGEHIKAAVQSVASSIKIEGKGHQTYKKLIGGGLQVSMINPISPNEYEIDQRAVTVGGSRIIRVRPIWNEWAVNVEFTLLDPELSPKIVLQLLQLAGLRAGIGDARGLGFGRFQVESTK